MSESTAQRLGLARESCVLRGSSNIARVRHGRIRLAGQGIGPAGRIVARHDGRGAALRGGTGDTRNASAVEADIATSAAGGNRGERAAGTTGSWRGCGSDRHARRRGRRGRSRMLAWAVSAREWQAWPQHRTGRSPCCLCGGSQLLTVPADLRLSRAAAARCAEYAAVSQDQDAADELRRARGSGLCSAPIARASWG